jgi:hypothetical protein
VRRTSEGKSKREIIRCLKRYVAREIYTALTQTSEQKLARAGDASPRRPTHHGRASSGPSPPHNNRCLHSKHPDHAQARGPGQQSLVAGPGRGELDLVEPATKLIERHCDVHVSVRVDPYRHLGRLELCHPCHCPSPLCW